MAMPVFAQYAGPAILSRGEAPSAMIGPQVSFRPFLEVNGVYNTGLSSVSVDSQGNVANQSSTGIQIVGGISGSHSWRHTTIGLSYRGDYSHYFGNSQFDTSDHTLLLGIKHQFTRHISLSLNNSFGIINRDYGLLSTISQAVPFDPSQSYIPTTDFFDNRTIFAASQANLVIQRSTRLSFSLGGGIFVNRRASSALYGVTGLTANGDVQYRLSKRATAGANYSFTHYGFTGLINSTVQHTVSGTLAYQLSRFWEFSGYAGIYRVETKFVQNVPVDPAIAAIIGITESSEVVYDVRYGPNAGARLSRTFRTGVLYGTVSNGITPGNGLFLTSVTTSESGGYTYTGLRRWSIGADMSHQQSTSIGNVIGKYGGISGGLNAARRIVSSINMVAGVTAFKYDSSVFTKYNQVIYSAHLGLGWTPGDLPLRIW